MKQKLFGLFIFAIAFAGIVHSQTDIRKVDFKNFTFQPHCAGDQTQKVTVKKRRIFQRNRRRRLYRQILFQRVG